MLIVTHGCNLNCTYCYEKFKNGSKRMDVSLAKEIIRKEIDIVKNDERFGALEVDFMGGEPLLRFDLIKEVVEWMEAECDVPFICFATTNATLVTESMKEWLRRHKDYICLGASYDGIAGDAQSVNRGEAATKVDLDFFRETWPYQGFKMTPSKESLPYIYDSLVDAARKGYIIGASLAQGVDWNVDDAVLFHEQLIKLGEFYLDHPDIEPCNLLTRGLTGIGDTSEYQNKFCGSGTYMATYDVDGTLYGCHMFTPLVLGKRAPPHSGFTGWSDEKQLTDSFCKGCKLMRWCSTCIGFNLLDRGAVNIRDHRWCAMNAAHALAACQFQLMYFSRLTQQQEMNQFEAGFLQKALNAYEHLKEIDITKPFPQ